MNTRLSHFQVRVLSRRGAVPDRRGERGSAVVVVVALMALMLLYLAVNIRTLSSLTRELRLVERKQTRRLAVVGFSTNSVLDIQVRTNVTARAAVERVPVAPPAIPAAR
jgi:hypothetical protein